MSTVYLELEKAIEHSFSDDALLLEALTHTSYGNENKAPNNERLEFLGDSIVNVATTEILYRKFPNRQEGHLSRLRARLVNTESLAQIAVTIRLGAHLRLGIGEEASGGRAKESILADALEALLGAVFLDVGFEPAAKLVRKWMDPRISNLYQDVSAKKESFRDDRSRFQEHIQAIHKITPTFETLSEEGPAHAPVFTVRALVDGKEMSTGTGSSKRSAIQQAAKRAMHSVDDEE